MAILGKGVGENSPAAFYLVPCLSKGALTGFNTAVWSEQFGGDGFELRPEVRGFATQTRAVDPIRFGCPSLSTDGPFRGIGGYPQCPQVTREFPTPFAEGTLPYMQSDSRLTECLHDHVHMGMWFIGVQHHGIAMPKSEFLPSEALNGRQHFHGRRPRRHGEHQFVNQLGRSAATSVKIRLTAMLLEIQIPVLEQILRHILPRKPLAIVSLKLKLPVFPKTQVVKVTMHRTEVLAASTEHFDHDFRGTSDRPGDLLNLRR